jgi:cell fate (sporulation/competence/biofilm development) regulator YlbF (YheA/YmcA/DUF963 family)
LEGIKGAKKAERDEERVVGYEDDYEELEEMEEEEEGDERDVEIARLKERVEDLEALLKEKSTLLRAEAEDGAKGSE